MATEPYLPGFRRGFLLQRPQQISRNLNIEVLPMKFSPNFYYAMMIACGDGLHDPALVSRFYRPVWFDHDHALASEEKDRRPQH
jgi:hypothetical protein